MIEIRNTKEKDLGEVVKLENNIWTEESKNYGAMMVWKYLKKQEEIPKKEGERP